jgi:hypothetical protein
LVEDGTGSRQSSRIGAEESANGRPAKNNERNLADDAVEELDSSINACALPT